MSENSITKAAYLLSAGNHQACHELVQDDESPDANYLHALVHRRDGDLPNAMYWYRRVGDHPVLREMAKRHPGWSYDRLDPVTIDEETKLLVGHIEGR